ncbi:hypothetical protein PF003_g9060 [Phytophthora fragariae]|nr:hypothetical protein PF003_g9060 [Phytophthora fragariae]
MTCSGRLQSLRRQLNLQRVPGQWELRAFKRDCVVILD